MLGSSLINNYWKILAAEDHDGHFLYILTNDGIRIVRLEEHAWLIFDQEMLEVSTLYGWRSLSSATIGRYSQLKITTATSCKYLLLTANEQLGLRNILGLSSSTELWERSTLAAEDHDGYFLFHTHH